MAEIRKWFVVFMAGFGVAVWAILILNWVPAGRDLVLPISLKVGPPLFDEAKVQQVYDLAGPAVVGIRRGEDIKLWASGFLIDRQGHIVTNYHVVGDYKRVEVRMSDTTSTTAIVLGSDPASDLALLKVEASAVAGIEPLQLGDPSLVRPGQLVISMGNPFEMEDSISVGIISGVQRAIPGRVFPFLQHDALLAPGSSGGPLLNDSGEIIGVNSNIVLFTDLLPEGCATFGLAIPINVLVEKLPELKARS